jgi:serine phosphatase RsbU (regulator of sigma subunit)
VLGDVSGKGLKAAMTVSLLVGTARTLAEQSSDPAWILAGLNRRLEGRMQNGFVTCLVLRLEPSGKCVAANAGHLPPFLNHDEMQLPAALPLGVVSDGSYENVAFTMAPGDHLTLYTDGLVEARNAARELFGFDRVRNLIAANPDAQTASEAAVAFGQDDDITVLTVTRIPTGAESATDRVGTEIVPTLA